MANYCVQCGIEIPEGQRVCSVCYGDPWYGRDGYLLEMMRYEQEMQQAERAAEDAQWEREKERERDD